MCRPRGKRGRGYDAVEQIAKLYRIERDLGDANDEARYVGRQTRSVPVLNALRAWLDNDLPTVPTQTALGKALAYLDNYWPHLSCYQERGYLPIDNNHAENAIRPFVVGRKA